MLVNSIGSFNNSKINMGMNVESETTSLSRGARRISRILASEQKPKPSKFDLPDLSPKEQKQLDKKRKQWKENPPPAPDKPREPEGTNW